MTYYNLEKHIHLLTLEKELKLKLGANALQRIDENLYLESLNYSVQLSDYFHWKNRHEYISLTREFVNLSINGFQFEKKFLEKLKFIESLVDYFEENPEKLRTISLDPKSKEFSRWTSEICDYYDDIFPAGLVDDFSTNDESQFRNAIQSILSEMENYL